MKTSRREESVQNLGATREARAWVLQVFDGGHGGDFAERLRWKRHLQHLGHPAWWGGGWGSSLYFLRVANRSRRTPELRPSYYGFRAAQTAE